MFDPSKLNLDLEQNEAEKNKKASEKKSSESDKIQQAKTSIPEEKVIIQEDIVDDILEVAEKSDENNDSENITVTEENVPQTNHSSQEQDIRTQEDTETENTKNYGSGKEISYDKEKIVEQEKKDAQASQEEAKKIIYDINVKEIKDIFVKLIEHKYDFMTIEPFDSYVKLSFRKDKIEKESLNIKYPVYTQILIKAKTLTGLKVDDSQNAQEGKWDFSWNTKSYKVLSKTVPGSYGEKVFLKLDEVENKKVKKVKKSVGFWQIMAFLWAALFAAMLIWIGFLSFVLLNATSVNQLEFFQNLWVDVSSVKQFTAQLVNIVFSVVILIETLFLFTFTFKAVLTKKNQKWLKIKRTIFAVFFLILTFITGTLWMVLSNKINELRGQNYWKMITYDNSKYISPIFDENGSIVSTNKSFIGPVTLRFDIAEKLNQINNESNFKPEKIVWIIDERKIEKPINDTQLIQTFDTLGLHEVNIRFEWKNLAGEDDVLEQQLAKINVNNIINIEQENISGGWVWYIFDAENIKDLWKVEWYYIPDTNGLEEAEANKKIAEALAQPTNTWYEFNSKILFDEELILWMKILETGEDSSSWFDKIFVFSNDASSNEISADIISEADLNNDSLYTLRASNIETLMWNGYVSEFLWKIWEKTIRQKADLRDLEASSQIEFDFEQYWNYTVELEIIDSRGNSQTIEKEIIIEKKLKFSSGIFILNNKKPVENLEYNKSLHEYLIDQLWVPTTLSLNARSVRSEDKNYKLRELEWDFEGDNDIDSKKVTTEYEVATEWRHHIKVHFVFEHIKDTSKIINVTENIFIEAIKKEAQIDFDIKKDSAYAPVTVSLDASRSQVKNEDIVKFEWDYGDGITEIRDAIVPWHKYPVPWDYDIKLTVTTESWKQYSTSKKLVLKPKPQTIEITTSMKKAPVRQWIDFLSDESEWQITAYFWDFWDGNTSTQANPTHAYQKAGTYTVTLKLDFANNNVLDKTVEIEIIEE